MRKYAWLMTLALLGALALLLSACAGETAPPTPRSTITPTSIPPAATTSTTTTVPLINGVPAIPHPVAGYENCLVCHATGVSGSPAVPADHAGRSNDTCQACHQTLTATATATGTGTPTATGTVTPTQTTTSIPEIPHTLVGRDDCLACHQTGGGGAPAVPADHAGRTNSSCTMCHQQAPTATTTTTTTPTSTTTSPTTTTTATATTTTSSGIPQIPHFTDGYTQCLVCHQDGIGGAPAVPADHAGRTESTCAMCHTPAANQVALSYPGIPHDLTGRENCLMCHQDGLAGAPAVPSDHAGRTNDICTVCHKTAPDD